MLNPLLNLSSDLKIFFKKGTMKYFERRMCTFTNETINAKDRGSVQLFLAQLDANGRATGEVDIVDIAGCIRQSGEVDALLLEYSRNNQ